MGGGRGRRSVQRNDTPSWTLSADAPTDLKFVICVARVLGILPEDSISSFARLWPGSTATADDEAAKRILGPQWKAWWLTMMRKKRYNAQMGQRMGERWSHWFEPAEQFQTNHCGPSVQRCSIHSKRGGPQRRVEASPPNTGSIRVRLRASPTGGPSVGAAGRALPVIELFHYEH